MQPKQVHEYTASTGQRFSVWDWGNPPKGFIILGRWHKYRCPCEGSYEAPPLQWDEIPENVDEIFEAYAIGYDRGKSSGASYARAKIKDALEGRL